MDTDQRLTPIPYTSELQTAPGVYSGNYSNAYNDLFDGKRSIQHYFNVLYKRLPIILAIAILGTAAAALYSYRQPAIYEAEIKLVIEPHKPPQTQKEAISINLNDDQKYYKTQIELLRTPELMKRVVVALGLHREANLFGDRSRGFFARLTSFGDRSKSPSQDNSLPVIDQASLDAEKAGKTELTPEENRRAKEYVKVLLDELQIKQTEGTNIVNISVQDPNPELALKVSYKTAELFIEQDAELEMSGAQKAFADLGNSIEELKVTIANQEVNLIDYMRSSGLPLQEKGQDLAASRLEGMSVTWLKAMESRRNLEARYNAAVAASTHGQGVNIPDIYENKNFQDAARLNTESRSRLRDQIRDIDKQIRDAENLKAELLVRYTPTYIKVQEVSERIAALKASREKTEREVLKVIDLDQAKIEKNAVSGALQTLKSQVEAARTQESEAQAAYDNEAARANIQGQAQTKLTTLKREIETNRGLLDTYTQRQKEQELSLAGQRPNNIKIQNKAGVPDEPIGPQRGRNILIALFLSLGAGVGVAFLLDYLDDSIRSSNDVSRLLGLPTLALIPHYEYVESRKLISVGKERNENGSSSALVSALDGHSPMAEAYKHLRTSLLFSSAGKPPKTILVTSSQPSDGKTTTAINTAITLAQSGADVVIIDCDLRRPRLDNLFGLPNTIGITNYLSGDIDVESLTQSYDEVPGLKVITSGPIPPNPAELLSSNQMQELLVYLSGQYKHVIIDTPPAISFADATILSTLVDGVVLVAMANKSSTHLMGQLRDRLTNIGVKIFGVVLNDINGSSTDYYYSSEYYSSEYSK